MAWLWSEIRKELLDHAPHCAKCKIPMVLKKELGESWLIFRCTECGGEKSANVNLSYEEIYWS